MTHSSLLPALAVNIETPSLAGSAGGYLVFDDATYGKFDTGKFAPLGGYQKDQVALTRQVNVKRGDSSPTDVMFHAQTGTASVVLDNRTRTFDPVSNTDVRPMRGVNITATWGGTPLASDTFNRTNQTPMGSTNGSGTLDPLTWTSQEGTWEVFSNTATLSAIPGSLRAEATVNLATADVDISANATSQAIGGYGAGICFRFTNISNYWTFINYQTTNYRLYKVVGGTPTLVADLSTSAPSNTLLRIVASGSSITCYAAGVQVLTATDTFNQSATLHGVYMQGNTSMLIDNWSALTANTTYDLFTGFVTDWNETYPASGKDAVTTAQCADGSYLLVNANVADTFPVESTGARVNELLDLAEWPQVLRAVEAGSIQMHASIPTGSAWSAMQEAADSEMGDLYVAADGTMTFRASTSLVSDSRSTTSQATFGDAGTELPYSDVVLSYDTKRIHNTVSVSYNEAGDVVYQSDAVSLNAYGPSAFNVQAAINDKASAQHLADFIVNLYAQPLIRVDSLVLKPARSPSTLWPQALGLEIGDRITVKLTPPGGGSRISRDGWVRGIEHQITADGDWTTTFTLQDVSNLASYIIFDTSVFDGTDQFWF